MNEKAAVFLDRDGTINRDVPYCSSPDEFKLMPGAGEAISRLNQAGLKVAVITNQSGIARGYFTEETLHRIHEKMQQDLARYNAYIDAVYYCPHHPDDGCNCRKPKPSLIFKAAEELGVDLKSSFMIGDSLSDIEAGRKAGCITILINHNGNVKKDILADYICKNLNESVEWILDKIVTR